MAECIFWIVCWMALEGARVVLGWDIEPIEVGLLLRFLAVLWAVRAAMKAGRAQVKRAWDELLERTEDVEERIYMLEHPSRKVGTSTVTTTSLAPCARDDEAPE